MMCIQTTWSPLLWKICEVEIGCYSRTVKRVTWGRLGNWEDSKILSCSLKQRSKSCGKTIIASSLQCIFVSADTRAKVQILLSPGDLIVMSGTARYKWTHEINRNKDQQVWQGEALKQERRISVTLRRLCPQLVLGD
jgi:hypothetical protein